MKTPIIIMLVTSLFGCNPEKDDFTHSTPPTVSPDNGNDEEGDNDNSNPDQTNSQMKIIIGNKTFTATLVTNNTTKALKEIFPLTLNMSDFNSNEKVGTLPISLPTSSSNPTTIQEGDIMLYGSSSIVLFYETFQTSYSYTRIGKIDNPSGLRSVLDRGGVTIKFELK